ncbi:MAG: hypothetical protein A2889_10700 [Nitrospinae bacterium RIFCSPLOWO2_01_FULL_39_10]|nr:MAG: hypothetical protein A2889_10700 [Nitrospinae bacterium RIFCSPLOWO2_01_FULL_39_10]
MRKLIDWLEKYSGILSAYFVISLFLGGAPLILEENFVWARNFVETYPKVLFLFWVPFFYTYSLVFFY